MNARVCVPYRSDGDLREKAWKPCKEFWEKSPWPLYVGDTKKKLFSQSQARNVAARGKWDVAVFSDADILPANVDRVADAIERAFMNGLYMIAHDRLHYLDLDATNKLIRGLPFEPTETFPRGGETIFAIRRDLWDLAGGFDERFLGWGGNGIAFAAACQTLRGAERVPGDIYHLWHGPYWNERPPNPHFDANMALARRYKEANVNGIMELIAERS